MTPKARIIPCLDVKDGPRRPQPRSGEDGQGRREAAVR
jgi:imidazole glycerol phosphate synthase subunit HisF